MGSFNRVDKYEKLYYKELERREALNRRVSLPLGLIMVLFGTIPSYFIPVIEENIFHWKNKIIFICLLGMVFTLGLTVYHLIKSYLWSNIRHRKRYRYIYVPLPDEIEDYLKRVEDPEKEYREMMVENYAISTRINFLINNKREGHFHKTLEWLVYTLLVAALLIFIINYPLVSVIF